MNNPLKTLNQLRAEYAYKCVEQVKNTNAASRYKSLAKKLPQMITYNGLLTTLAFLKSKAKYEKKSGKTEINGDFFILAHLTLWLERKSRFEPVKKNDLDGLNKTINEFLKKVYNDWNAHELFLKTAEALAIAQWLKRIAEGELDD
jgi:CRISPR-associated protein Cmr5